MDEKQGAANRSVGRALCWPTALVGAMLTTVVLFAPHANAEGNETDKIFKRMSDYLASQKTLSITFDSDIEVITNNMQKIQFTSSGQVQLSRPDKLRATRTGGYTDVEIVFDGKTLTVNNKSGNDFAQVEAAGSVDQVIDLLRDNHGVTAPGADLLLSNPFDVLMADVMDRAQIGIGVIDGVECDHLAFRNEDTDWQIWIEAGARPIPRKYVITNKGVTGAPQYTLRIKEWRTDVRPTPLRSSRRGRQESGPGRSHRYRRSAARNRDGRSKEMIRTSTALIRLSTASRRRRRGPVCGADNCRSIGSRRSCPQLKRESAAR